jgi:hypothetical protein
LTAGAGAALISFDGAQLERMPLPLLEALQAFLEADEASQHPQPVEVRALPAPAAPPGKTPYSSTPRPARRYPTLNGTAGAPADR